MQSTSVQNDFHPSFSSSDVSANAQGSICKFQDQITFVKDPNDVPLRREHIRKKTVYTISKIDQKSPRPATRIEDRSEHSKISPDQRELIAEIDKNLKQLNDQKRFLQMAKECRPDRTWDECLSANKSIKKSSRPRSSSERTPRQTDAQRDHVCAVLQKLFEQNCIKIADSGTQVGVPMSRRRTNREECLPDNRAKSRSKKESRSARNKRNFAQNVCLWNEFAEGMDRCERECNSPVKMVSSGTQVGPSTRSSKRYSSKKRGYKPTSSESIFSPEKGELTTCDASEGFTGSSADYRSKSRRKKDDLCSDECIDKFKKTYITSYKPRKGQTYLQDNTDKKNGQSRIEKEVKTRVIYTRSPGKIAAFTSDDQSPTRAPKPTNRGREASGSYADSQDTDSIEKDLNRLPYKPLKLSDELRDYTHQKIVRSGTKSYRKSSLQSPRKYGRNDGHVSFRSRTKTIKSRQVRLKTTNDEGDPSPRPLYRISEHRIKIKESREKVHMGHSSCRSGDPVQKLQTDMPECSGTNNLSAASSSTRLRNLSAVTPNVIDDSTYTRPDSDDNKNYLILPYEPTFEGGIQPSSSPMRCSHCLQELFSADAKNIEKSAVILEDISSRESRVYTDSYQIQDTSIQRIPSSQYVSRVRSPINVPILLRSLDEFQRVTQVRSTSDIDNLYRPSSSMRPSQRDSLRNDLISKSDSQVKSQLYTEDMYRRSEMFSESDVNTSLRRESEPRRSTRFSQESLLKPRISVSEYEKRGSSPRRSSTAPRVSQYEKRESSPRRSSAEPQGPKYDERYSEARRSSAAPRESLYEKRESSPRRSSAAPRESLYDKRKSSPRMSSAEPRESQYEKRDSESRRISAAPRESLYDKRESSPRRSSAAPRESQYEKRESSPRRSSAVPRESLYEKRDSEPRRSSALPPEPPRESPYEKRESEARGSSAPIRESLYEKRRSSTPTRDEKRESEPRTSSKPPRQSLAEKRASEPRGSSTPPRESVYEKRESAPRRSSSPIRESLYEKRESGPRRSSSPVRESLYEKRESEPRRSSTPTRESLYEKRESAPRRSSSPIRESLYEKRESGPRRSSSPVRESLYEKRESEPRRSSTLPRESLPEPRQSAVRRSSASPRESLSEKRASEARRSSIPARESLKVEDEPEPRTSLMPRRESIAKKRSSEPRRSSTPARESLKVEDESEPRTSLIPPRESIAEKRPSEPRRSSTPVRESLKVEDESEPRTSLIPPRESIAEKRPSEPRRSSTPVRESLKVEDESEPRTSLIPPRESIAEKRPSEPRRSSTPVRESLKVEEESEPRTSLIPPRESIAEERQRRSSTPARAYLNEKRESEPRTSSTPARQSIAEKRASEPRRSSTTPRESIAEKRPPEPRRSSASPRETLRLTDMPIRRESAPPPPRWTSISPQDDAQYEETANFVKRDAELRSPESMSSLDCFICEPQCAVTEQPEVVCPVTSNCDYECEVTEEYFIGNVVINSRFNSPACETRNQSRERESRSPTPHLDYWYDLPDNEIKRESEPEPHRRSSIQPDTKPTPRRIYISEDEPQVNEPRRPGSRSGSQVFPSISPRLQSVPNVESEDKIESYRRSATDSTRSKSLTEIETKYEVPHVDPRPSKTAENVSTTNTEDERPSIHLKSNARESKKEIRMSSTFRTPESPDRSFSLKSPERSSYESDISSPLPETDQVFLSEIQDQNEYIKGVDSELQNFIHYLQNRLKDCDEMVRKQLITYEQERKERYSRAMGEVEAPPTTTGDAVEEQLCCQRRSPARVDFGAEGDCPTNLPVEIDDLALPLESSRMSGSDNESCHCGQCGEDSSDSSDIPPFTGCDCMKEDYYKIMRLAYRKKRDK